MREAALNKLLHGFQSVHPRGLSNLLRNSVGRKSWRQAEKNWAASLDDGIRIAEEHVERSEPSRFVDVEHAIPPELVGDKRTVTVRFQAKEDRIATIFGVRMIRGDAQR